MRRRCERVPTNSLRQETLAEIIRRAVKVAQPERIILFGSAAIRAILLAQTETGVVPNIAGGSGRTPDRSQPPVGSYVVWKDYQRIQDRELLEWAYPRLKKWHEWWLHDRGDGQPWRDGNRDGLLEWGSDRGAASFDVAAGEHNVELARDR